MMATKQAKTKSENVAKALGLSEETCQTSVDVLTTSLAATFALYTKTRKFHWNVTGLHFIQLHKLFEGQYEELDEEMDAIAERIRQLGAVSIGTLAEMQKHSYLEEDPGTNPDEAGMIAELLADHEEVIRHLRADVEEVTDKGDAGT
ncbi:MAG TPA: DNA starvation/stationary phase protection protein, partial [Candidatus Limnocylindrales bacterium]|nr:DNA starvation/stationary phase protection protein [Candidatus Limnocylindrales bacterium]